MRNRIQQNQELWRELTGEPSPESCREARQYALQTAAFALATASLLQEISEGLSRLGVPVLTFKGLSWSKLLYGNITSRPFGDLDLLVPPENLGRAHRFMLDLGLKRGYPSGCSAGQEAAIIQYSKAQSYSRPQTSLSVDLHWRLFSQWIAVHISFWDLWDRRTLLEVDGFTPIPTLGHEDAILFTCLHSTQDGWSYLKGLLDLALFLERRPPDWSIISRIAPGRLPLVSQAITFAVHLLGAPGPVGWKPSYPDPDRSLAAFTAIHRQAEPPQLALLKPNLWSGSKVRALWRSIQAVLTPAIDDIHSVDLPPQLISLYIPIRAFRLIQKLTQRRRLK